MHFLKINIAGFLVIFVVVLITQLTNYRISLQSETPIRYHDDSLFNTTRVMFYANGDFNPLLPHYASRLGAPEKAAWSDFPCEKMVYYPAGFFAKVFGLNNGITIYLSASLALAGALFFLVGRMMRYRNDVLIMTSILFGLAPMGFVRNINHLNLSIFWQVPLLIFILIWCGWRERIVIDRRAGLLIAIVSGFVAGNLNPYYLFFFLFVLGIILLGALVDFNRGRILEITAVIGACLAGFAIQNIDTLIYTIEHGRNQTAFYRSLWGMITWGFYLPDIFFPRFHVDPGIQQFSNTLYQGKIPAPISGESQTAYIGVVSVVGFMALMISGAVLVVGKKFEKISPYFWISSSLLLFAMVGGINYLLGAFGFMLLRSSNRVSILLSCMALYFINETAQTLPKRNYGVITLLVLVLGIGFYDQIPNLQADLRSARDAYQKDQKTFSQLESQLPPKAMIFTLPVVSFPESSIPLEMGVYDHLRPLLQTKELRFSYGCVAGRENFLWQQKVAALPPTKMSEELLKKGFDAVLINKRAYHDHAEGMILELEKLFGNPILEDQEFCVLRLALGKTSLDHNVN
jgi:phosphoglycerol transferase